MRWLPTLLLAISAPAFAGEPVLLPDFTPGTTSEFGVAYMLQERVVIALQDNGHVILDQAAVDPVVGPMEACADRTPDCPLSQLDQLPARIAIVVRVERAESAISADSLVFIRGQPKPADVRHLTVEPGREDLFGNAVAVQVGEVLNKMGPPKGDELVAAVKLISAAEDARNKPPETVPVTPVEPVEPVAPTNPPASQSSTEKRLASAGMLPRHIVGSKKAFDRYAGSAREFLYQQTPHAGRITVEVRGGIGLGDTSRGAIAWSHVDEDLAVLDDWYREGPSVGRGLRPMIYAGYSPATYIDLGATFGLQYGSRSLTTAYTQDGDSDLHSSSDQVQAAQFLVAPRVRFYMAPLGLVKPYGFAGGEIRIFDRYKIAEEDGDIDYPNPAGGIVPGAQVGGGLLLDPGPLVGFFVEGNYTRHFGNRSVSAETDGGKPDGIDNPEVPSLQTVGIEGGVQFRL